MDKDGLPKSLIVVLPQQDAALCGSLRALQAKVGMKMQENVSFLQSMWAQIQGALQPPSGTVRAAPKLVPTTAKPLLQTHVRMHQLQSGMLMPSSGLDSSAKPFPSPSVLVDLGFTIPPCGP